MTKRISITGEVEALATVDVVPKVIGELETLRLSDGKLIEVGTPVEKGKVIAIIEHKALSAAVAQAEAALEVANATAKRARVRFDNSERERNRWENLYKQGSATEQQRDQAVTAYESASAEVTLAEAQVKQAAAALRQAKVTEAEAKIKAPITGIVSEKYVDEGNMVGPTKPLLRIVQVDTVEIVGKISERHIPNLTPGKTATSIIVDAYPDEVFEGIVYSVGAEVDRRTRTVKIEVRMANPGHRLIPGMFARMDVILRRAENVPVISNAALLRKGPEVYVYIVNNKTAHQRILKLGLAEGDRHEVVEGLSEGDMVVIKGQSMLRQGDAVEFIEEAR